MLRGRVKAAHLDAHPVGAGPHGDRLSQRAGRPHVKVSEPREAGAQVFHKDAVAAAAGGDQRLAPTLGTRREFHVELDRPVPDPLDALQSLGRKIQEARHGARVGSGTDRGKAACDRVEERGRKEKGDPGHRGQTRPSRRAA